MKGLNTALGAAGLAAFLALGEVVPRVGIVKETYFPPTSEIASAFWDEVKDGAFWSALGDTLTGWALGLAIAVGAGIAAGVLLSVVPYLREATASTIEFLRPIPSVALIPLVVLLYGSGPRSALVLVVYAAFWQVLVQVMYGVADVDPVVRDTARSYRFSRWTTVRTVLWPTALPYVVTGFRLAAAVALILEITAELIIGVPGLGRSIGVAQSSGAVATTYALVVVVGLVGVLVNLLARGVERRALRWHSSVRKDLA